MQIITFLVKYGPIRCKMLTYFIMLIINYYFIFLAMLLAVICACQFPEIIRPSFLMANVLNENTKLIVNNHANKKKLYYSKNIVITIK